MTYLNSNGERPTTKPADLGDAHLTAVGEVYRVKWSDVKITAQIDRIYESSRRETFGEVLIEHSTNGNILYQSRVNLTNQSSRTKAGREIFERFETDWTLTKEAWESIFHRACLRVLNERRKGVPPVSASAMPPPEMQRWRIEPYIEDGQSTILFGDGDSGKSMLATYWGILVATGHVENHQVPRPGAVLYLDYESDKGNWWERINAMTGAMGVPRPDNFHYKPMAGHRLSDEITSVNQDVMDLKAELVIIDSGAPAVGDPLAVADTVAYLNALRSLGPSVASLTICHLPKNTLGTIYPFGSAFWRNLPRANWKVEADHAADGTLITGLLHTKSNNGRRHAPRAFRFSFEDSEIRVFETDPNQVEAMAEARPAVEKIADALADGPMTIADLAEIIESPRNTISQTLTRWRGRRFETYAGTKKWCLLGQEVN